MHIIRLRGPWLVVREGQSASVEFPTTWQAVRGQIGLGPLQFVRRFGLPTGLEPGDRIELVIDGKSFLESVALNGNGLGGIPTTEIVRFGVTEQLQTRNELTLSVQVPADAPPEALLATIVEVRLEISQAGAVVS